MFNFALTPNEVILYEGSVSSKQYKSHLLVTLTSEKIAIETERGVFKKTRELVDIIELSAIKFYNDEVQVKQKGADVEIQTTRGNIVFTFSGIIEAGKFKNKATDATTKTTLSRRISDKTKGTFDMVDETLGLDTRGTIKGVVESGIKGVIINGIGKKR